MRSLSRAQGRRDSRVSGLPVYRHRSLISVGAVRRTYDPSSVGGFLRRSPRPGGLRWPGRREGRQPPLSAPPAGCPAPGLGARTRPGCRSSCPYRCRCRRPGVHAGPGDSARTARRRRGYSCTTSGSPNVTICGRRAVLGLRQVRLEFGQRHLARRRQDLVAHRAMSLVL